MTTFAILCTALSAIPLQASSFITHFTPRDSDFVSELILRNATNDKQKIFISAAYGSDDSQGITVDLEGGETRILTGSDFTHWPSHIRVLHDLVHVSIRYKQSNGGNAVIAPPVEDPARAYRWGYLEADDFWQGLSMVNVSALATDVVLRQHGERGLILREFKLAELLGNNQKLLVVVSDLDLVEDPNSYLDLVADQPIAAQMLFGSQDQSSPMMSTYMAEKVFHDHIYARFSGGFAGFYVSLTLDREKIIMADRIKRHYNFEEIRDQLLAMGAAEIDFNIDHDCCDLFFYTFEIFNGTQRNSFAFSGLDIDLNPEDPQAQKAWEIMAYIFGKGHEITGSEVFTPFK